MSKRLSFDTAAPMLSQNYASGAVVERRQYGSRDGTPGGIIGGGAGVGYGNSSSQSLGGRGCGGSRQRNSLMLFERASPSWWNPRFASNLLENQYLRCAFPQIRLRFRFGLMYAALTAFVWFVFHAFASVWRYSLIYQLSASALICLLILMLLFTFNENWYQKFYAPAGFLCTFILIGVSLLFFCVQNSLISPVGTFTASLEIVLLLYTVIPLPLYVCATCGLLYSILYEILSVHNLPYEYQAVKFSLHLCAHILGIHLFILTQVRNRKTFIKIGQSLLASKDLEAEKQFKDNMIESVMPRKVAEELLKETIEFRRPSTTTAAARGSIFRPFTMNLMTDVSILFADIAGFTKMSSNKSADELVNLLNDLFGRFDKLCTATGCEKISTLGDCYYCVSGCPEPRPDHAKCCVEMGLSMCVAIIEFDRDRNQDVNMRVGIHTGTVMCGIVGTKRFKFDVFSNDVNLANTMESSGKAGRVHLSEKTLAFLGNDYILEEGDVVDGLKTYFVSGRTTTNTTKIYSENSLVNVCDHSPSGGGGGSKQNIMKVGSPDTPFSARLKDDLRHIDSSEIEYEIGNVEPRETSKLTSGLNVAEPTKKSASLAVLSSGTQQTRSTSRDLAPKRITFSKNAGLSASSGVIPETMTESQTSGGYGSGNGVNTMGKDFTTNSEQFVADHQLVSETPAAGAPNNTTTAASKVDLTAHATSITRFDTAHMDFDQRLVNSIQNSSVSTEGYWSHENAALNPWTLNFRDKNVELDYRRHFSNRYGQSSEDDAKVDEKWRVTAPKYSVFFDVLVATAIYVIIVGVAFGVFGFVSAAWITYFALSALVLVGFLTFASVNLVRKGLLSPPLTNWIGRHLAGLLFIDLPLGAAYANMFCVKKLWSSNDSTSSYHHSSQFSSSTPLSSSVEENELIQYPDALNTSHQLVIVYILFVVMIAHCNFSQLVFWTKSSTATLIGVSLIVLVNCCLCVCDTKPTTLLQQVYVVGVRDQHFVTYATTWNESRTSFLRNNFEVRSSTLSTTPTPPDFAVNNNASSATYYFELTRKYLFHPAVFYGVPIYRYEIVLDVLLALVLIFFLNYQFESNFRMSFYGDKKAYLTIMQMSSMKEQADWLLFNIIPHHIQDQLMKYSKYSENHEMVAVVFASIVNWHEMYEENFEGGREFLRVLNELVADFDELLDRSEFVQVEKIKTIGTTYMAASGLNAGRRRLSMHPYSHLYELMEFALALQDSLENFNKDLLNFDFKMKIGYNIGPVTAGVIGSTKLYYDIWGDTVNIASRMYSTGKVDRIQVSEKARNMLQDVYDFEYRDHIEVKGIDGGMEVYLVKGRRENMQPRSRTGTASTPS